MVQEVVVLLLLLLIKLMTEDSVTQSNKNIVTETAALTHTIRFRKRLNTLNARLSSLILSQRKLI